MLIRYGYEITLICAQPTALVCLLSVHDDHAKSIRVPERVFSTPIIPMTTYRDLFGNQRRRLAAPGGPRRRAYYEDYRAKSTEDHKGPVTDLDCISPPALLRNPRPPGRRVPPDPPSGPAGAAHWKAPG